MTKMPMPKNRAKATISKGRVVKRFTGLALAEALDASALALAASMAAFVSSSVGSTVLPSSSVVDAALPLR